MNKSFDIALDIEKDLYTPGYISFTVSRNDFETVDLFFTISQDNKPLNLEGTTVELAIKKPSGLTVYQECEISDALNGKAQTRLSIQGYIEFGVHNAELYVRSGNQLAVSCPFYFYSRDAVMFAEGNESINDWSALQQALFAYDLKPVITEGFPIDYPEYVGQLAFDIVNKITYIATDLTNTSWQSIGSGSGGGGTDTILGTGAPGAIPVRLGQIYIDTAAPAAYIATGVTAASWEQIDNTGAVASLAWTAITGKPDSFKPDMNDAALTAALAGKADDADLAAKADIDHTHDIADVNGLQVELDSKLEAIPPEYLTDTEAAALYQPKGTYLTSIPATYATDAEVAAGYAPKTHTHTAANITDFAAGVAANIPAAYLTDTEAAAIYQPKGTYLTAIPPEYLTEAEGDAKYLTAIPPEYLTEAEGDVRYEAKGTAAPAPVWGDLTGTIANQADLQSALNGKVDDAELTAGLAGKANTTHTHTIAEVTGLQTALDGKVDDVQLEGIPTYDDVYVKSEVYNKTEVDQMTMGTGGGSAIIVEDNLASTSTTNALSANQGRILSTTKASVNHNHTTANITDFAAGVAANIPAEYLTTTEADIAYASKAAEVVDWGEITGSIANQTDLNNALAGKSPTNHSHTAANITDFGTAVAANIPAAYLTDTEGNAAYAPKTHTHTATNITDFGTAVAANIPAEYLTATEGDAAYAPKNHTHTTANITDFAAGVAANIPAAYLTDTEANAVYSVIDHTHTTANITDFAAGVAANIPATYATDAEVAAAYQPKGTYLTAVPLMQGNVIGGAMVGNGLAMSGNYLTVKRGADIGLAGDNSLFVNSIGGKKIWTGSQADYNLITTPDPNTLYFIT